MLTKKEVTICIIELRAPSTECWNNLNLDSDDGHSIADPYRWICDRYLYSDLAQWAAPSLRFEYRYITRGDLNGFPKGAITDVKVDPDKLNAIIAEYTVYHAEPSMELYSKVFAMAVRYLKRNDYQSASALFEVYLQENPGDAKAINARGFCMLPEKPYDAERIILKALRNGFRDKAVGYYNLCCCQYLQKEPAKVLKTANLFWSEQSDAEKTYSGALLWKVTEGMCELKFSGGGEGPFDQRSVHDIILGMQPVLVECQRDDVGQGCEDGGFLFYGDLSDHVPDSSERSVPPRRRSRPR